MIPLQIDLIGAAGCYGILLLMYSALHTSKTHSIASRIFSALFSYVFSFFVIDYAVNCVIVFINVFTSPDAILGLTGFVCMNGILYWLIDKFSDKTRIVETMNFVRSSLIFGNYFRLRDVDTQEQIGTYRMKELYKEVHGKPFRDEVIATAFDEQVTKFKRVSIEELQKKEKHYPPEYFEELEDLKQKQRRDVSVSFRFQLMDAGFHPFLRLMEQFEIDPVTKILSFNIIFPLLQSMPVSTPAERSRLCEKTYESLHILIAQEWFPLYAPFVANISVLCCKAEFTDEMREVVVPLMSFQISMHALRIRGNRITTVTNIHSIAKIEFL